MGGRGSPAELCFVACAKAVSSLDQMVPARRGCMSCRNSASCGSSADCKDQHQGSGVFQHVSAPKQETAITPDCLRQCSKLTHTSAAHLICSMHLPKMTCASTNCMMGVSPMPTMLCRCMHKAKVSLHVLLCKCIYICCDWACICVVSNAQLDASRTCSNE